MSVMRDDPIERSVDSHWPEGFDPDRADVFAHNAVVVEAPTEKVWARLIAAAGRPSWCSNASDVVIEGELESLGQNATFTGKAFRLAIVSKPAEFVLCARLAWFGNGDQLRATASVPLVDGGALVMG
jgi:hypothetical protein